MPIYLLDKSVVRRTVEGIARAQRGEALRAEQAVCLTVLHASAQRRLATYITPQSLHILERLPAREEVRTVLEAVEVIQVGRYAVRWARRLREHGFTREDAVVLSLGTFGTNLAGDILGVEAVLTLDVRCISHFYLQQPTLARRLQAMTRRLPVPWRHAQLPELWQPARALTEGFR